MSRESFFSLLNWTAQTHSDYTVQAHIKRPAQGLLAHFQVTGNIDALELATTPGAEQKDGLWQSTCFEVFWHKSNQKDSAYWEVNCASNGDWNHYKLSDYRQNLTPVTDSAVKLTHFNKSSSELDISFLISLSPHDEILAAATMVLKTIDGTTSYWAQHLEGEKPDFHLPTLRTLKILGTES